ncbi:MAG: hypothetical protein LAN61_03185 [Acidobacteriia bacterium]|nr:hypothetical protein [Terriglobia bacterium]
MQADNLKFGGGASETALNPLVAVAMVITIALICVLRRKYVIAPLLAAAFLIPMDQVIVVGPFHFMMLRVLILAGWIRLIWTKLSSKTEIFSGGMNGIDKAMILSTLIGGADIVLLWGSSGALINQLGNLYTVFGMYFLLRFLIRDEEDIERAIRVFAYVAAVIAVVMMTEQATGRNPYSFLGGPREAVRQQLMERDDRFRAMAAFAHPILAGAFGAILLPIFIGLWSRGRKFRISALVGIFAATIITIASVSSTPALTYLAGIGALCLWPLRKRMRLLRWGMVTTLVSLHLVMKAPVWALIARVDVIGGSSGYHRYFLVDQFIRHFWDWWLLGVKSYAEWGWDSWDLANQYVAVGEGSGLIPFIFFLAVIVYGFKYVGLARKAVEGDKRKEFFFWALGAALFSNVIAFFGISYFDQTVVAWYAFLAMISTATAPFLVSFARPKDDAAIQSSPAGLFHTFPSMSRSRERGSPYGGERRLKAIDTAKERIG